MHISGLQFKIRILNKNPWNPILYNDLLIVNKNLLVLKSFKGNYYFLYKNIYSFTIIEGGLSQGLIISHNIDSYSSNLIVETSRNPKLILEQIKKIGFINSKNNVDEKTIKFVNQKRNKKRINVALIAVISNFIAIVITYLIYLITGKVILHIIGIIFFLGVFFILIETISRLVNRYKSEL